MVRIAARRSGFGLCLVSPTPNPLDRLTDGLGTWSGRWGSASTYASRVLSNGLYDHLSTTMACYSHPSSSHMQEYDSFHQSKPPTLCSAKLFSEKRPSCKHRIDQRRSTEAWLWPSGVHSTHITGTFYFSSSHLSREGITWNPRPPMRLSARPRPQLCGWATPGVYRRRMYPSDLHASSLFGFFRGPPIICAKPNWP